MGSGAKQNSFGTSAFNNKTWLIKKQNYWCMYIIKTMIVGNIKYAQCDKSFTCVIQNILTTSNIQNDFRHYDLTVDRKSCFSLPSWNSTESNQQHIKFLLVLIPNFSIVFIEPKTTLKLFMFYYKVNDLLIQIFQHY